jgi:hypothetical protein
MYWEMSTGICPPFQVTVLVPGRSVVSVRKGLPSTWPRRTAERSWLMGKSGFVMVVECVKDGFARSTRSLAGEHPVPEYVPQGAGGKPGVAGDVSLLPLQAPRRSAVAEKTAAGQRRIPRT